MEEVKNVVKSYFQNDKGERFDITSGQVDIFNSIYLKQHRRTQIIAPTQYGKSSTIAMALILRSQAYAEDWAIVTGSQPKSDIIMEKVIQHTFDDARIYQELDFKGEDLKRLKREKSKKHITWKCGGSIRTFTADARNRQRVKESLMGFGSPNIVEDESALIPNDLQSTVLRMLGGHEGGYLIKIGNPLYRNHFLKTWNSDKYERIFIDYHQGLREHRYTEEFIEEMRKEAFFDILYECTFPREDDIDVDGYLRLLKDNELARSKEQVDHKGDRRLGVDVGEGGDETVVTLRSDTYAEIIHHSKTKNLMAVVKLVADFIKQHNVKHHLAFIDATGIGAGVCSRLEELDLGITAVKWGERANDKTYANKKAEAFWKTRVWVIEGGKLEPRDEWNEFIDIKYKKDAGGKLKIKTKEEMRKEGIKSPDFADSLAFTFNDSLEDSAPNILSI